MNRRKKQIKAFGKRVHKDIRRTFFCEFMEEHEVDGALVHGVLSSDTQGNTSQTQDQDYNALGLTTATWTFYVISEELPADIYPGKHIIIDGMPMWVLKTDNQMGVLCLTLQQTISSR